VSYDGVKMSRELNAWRHEWRLAGGTAHHAGGGWPNRWVEAARRSPYAAGHVDAVAYPLLTFAAVSGWIALAIEIIRH
jgi:hypothetical protein